MYRFDNEAAPESLIRFTGELNPEWERSSTGLDFIEKLKQGFKNQLKGYFVDTFIIAKSRNEYFCLFFFTSHIYGYHKMLEAKWSIDEEDGRGWVQGTTQTDLFSQEKTIVNTTKFEREVREYLTEWRTNKEIYKFTLESGYLPKHISPILKQLHSKNVLELTPLDNTKITSTSYYLTYDNYKSDIPAKIKLKYTKR